MPVPVFAPGLRRILRSAPHRKGFHTTRAVPWTDHVLGWNLLPKNRIRHGHCKNVVRNPAGTLEWSPVDIGFIDWTSQFRALKDAGYNGGISLSRRTGAAALRLRPVAAAAGPR
jgi:sugar phosphate isomerase/epimerase